MKTNTLRMGLRIVALSSLPALGCDAPDAELDDVDAIADRDPNHGKADSADDGIAPHAGALRWSQMQALEGAPAGLPLFVSNNPEHVEGYGILAGVPHPGLSLRGAQRAPDAPEAQWTREVIDPRCPEGGVKEFGAYIAHILPSSLGAGRKVTFAVVAEQDTTVRVYGEMGTTDWSANGQLKTTRTDWLGAELAKSFFFRGNSPRRELAATAGKLLVIDAQSALSLVEGRYHVESDACLYPYTVAHAANLGDVVPGHYAPGDVKWPGWYKGQGYGRAAGVYEGDGWKGEQRVSIPSAPSVQGVGLLTPSDSFGALARHSDSAEILFGNYGALYDQTLHLDNDSGRCVDATVEFVSYLDRANRPDRTPTERFFLDTNNVPDVGDPPSMFWNGPVEVRTDAGALLHHAVLRRAPTAAERANPSLAMGSMRKALTTVRLDAGASESVQVVFPVPGYIVAPVALTVDAAPCG